MDLSPAPNRMKTIFAVLIFLLFAFPDSVRSELYKWVDENGKVHFTDSPRNIPKNSQVEIRKQRKTSGGQKDQKVKATKPTRFNKRQEAIFEEMENEIQDTRRKLKQAETRYRTAEEKYKELASEYSTDNVVDRNEQERYFYNNPDEKREAIKELQRLDEKFEQAKKNFGDMKLELKSQEFRLKLYPQDVEERLSKKGRQNL